MIVTTIIKPSLPILASVDKAVGYTLSIRALQRSAASLSRKGDYVRSEGLPESSTISRSAF